MELVRLMLPFRKYGVGSSSNDHDYDGALARYLDAIVAADATTTATREIYICSQRSTDEEFIRECTCIGKKLGGRCLVERIHVETSYSGFPIRGVAELLQRCCCTLTSICMGLLAQSSGTRQDYVFFFQSLAQCQQLKEITLSLGYAFGSHATRIIPWLEVSAISESERQQRQSWLEQSLFNELANIATLEEISITDDTEDLGEERLAALGKLCCNDDDGSNDETAKKKKKGLRLELDKVPLSSPFLERICGSASCLVSLSISGYRCGPCILHVSVMTKEVASALAINTTLKELHLDEAMFPDTAMTIVRGLEENRVLESLSLCIEGTDESPIAQSLLEALRRIMNTPQLENLTLVLQGRHSTPMRLAKQMERSGFLLEGLCGNNNLLHFRLESKEVYESGDALQLPFDRNDDDDDEQEDEEQSKEDLQQQVASALEACPALRDVRLEFQERAFDLNDTANFWLTFNQGGRKKLLENPNDRCVWVDTMIEKKNKTPIVFHIILTNPTMMLAPLLRTSSSTAASAAAALMLNPANRHHKKRPFSAL